MQLSCCRYLIETYYGFEVAGCALALLHPKDLFITATPYLKDEVKFIVKRRRAFTAARLSLSRDSANTELKCSTSGLVVTKAVRDAKNDLYDGQMAQLHDIDVTPDEVTTQRAQSVLKVAPNSIQFEGVSVPWRQMYPEPTDVLLCFS